jgi:hypothetical protein
VNIFGHAWVATAIEADPAFVLGSLLPDIEQLVGGAIASIDDPAVARGVQCHHRTDAQFHGSRAFVSLSTRARRWLGGEGLRRGPTLAVAHVGVELLIDGFIEQPEAEQMFSRALSHPAEVRWGRPGDTERFELIRRRIAEADIPRAYRDDAEVTRRVARMLSRRPRLALQDRELELVHRFVAQARPGVRAAMPGLREELDATVTGA